MNNFHNKRSEKRCDPRIGFPLVLFEFFVNGLELGLSSEGPRSADDTKYFWVAKLRIDWEELQTGGMGGEMTNALQYN